MNSNKITYRELFNDSCENAYMTDDSKIFVFSKGFGQLTLEQRKDRAENQAAFERVKKERYQEVRDGVVLVHPPESSSQ